MSKGAPVRRDTCHGQHLTTLKNKTREKWEKGTNISGMFMICMNISILYIL